MVEFFRKKFFPWFLILSIKYISIIKDCDKRLFHYIEKYSNNFSQNQEKKINSTDHGNGKKKRVVPMEWERERDGESTWQKEFSSWYWNNGGKKRKVDRLKARNAQKRSNWLSSIRLADTRKLWIDEGKIRQEISWCRVSFFFHLEKELKGERDKSQDRTRCW